MVVQRISGAARIAKRNEFAGCQVPVGRRQRAGESSAKWRTALLKKEPAIGDGSQSREKRQYKSIRGSVMCRNSQTERKLYSPIALTVGV
jgi:hypothetical protein